MIKKSEIWRRRVDLRQDHESIANAQTAVAKKKGRIYHILGGNGTLRSLCSWLRLAL
jgi:hypothetical protein